MNLVDSSGWIEYLEGGRNRAFFRKPLRAVSSLVVPAIVVYEVVRRVIQRRGEEAAAEVFDLLCLGQLVPTDETIALAAARLSVTHGLATADSLILATARLQEATLWTMDRHFEGLPGVEYVSREA